MVRLMGWQQPEPFLSRDTEIKISMIPLIIITIGIVHFQIVNVHNWKKYTLSKLLITKTTI